MALALWACGKAVATWWLKHTAEEIVRFRLAVTSGVGVFRGS